MVEEPKPRRGRPKGSKNKPKIQLEKKKRGRPRKVKESLQVWPSFEGVSFVKRKSGNNSETHRWAAVIDGQVIGYFKTPEEAHKARTKKQ